MSQAPYHGPFSMLPERRPPWKEFLFSMGAESVALLVLDEMVIVDWKCWLLQSTITISSSW